MPSNLYIAGTEARSGKSAVAVGLLHRLGRTAGRVGVFRPVVRSGEPDALLETLLSQLPTTPLSVADACGVTYEDMHADPEQAMGLIVDRFHEIAHEHDMVLVVGSDFSDVAAPTEFVVNARIAANLGSRMILVVPTLDRQPEDLVTSAEISVNAAREQHAHVAGVLANQVLPDRLAATRARLAECFPALATQVLPETPLLRAPTVRDLVAA